MRTIFSNSYTPQPQLPPSPMRSPLSVRIIEDNLEASRALISKWDPNDNLSQAHQLFSVEHSDEAKRFLTEVSRLQSAMHFYVDHAPASPNLVLAQTLTQSAMRRLEWEFRRLLESLPEYYPGADSVSFRPSQSDFEDAGSTFSDEDSPLASPSGMRLLAPGVDVLRAIGECMVSAGYGKECAKIYEIVRKSTVDVALYHLGVDRLSLSNVQKMDWDKLEVKVKTWLAAVKIAVKTVFNIERLLCDTIFSTSSAVIHEVCFSNVVSDGATALFSFPESVARCKTSPEKLFRLLDLYETVADLWPHVESTFNFSSTSGVRSLAVSALVKLGEAARKTLADFESAISKDRSKASVPGGRVPPLTRYVMNYLSLLADYTGPLSDVVADWPLPSTSPLPEASDNCAVRISMLVLVLLSKVDGKAESYNDAALSSLFLANNLRYVVNKVTASNLRFLLGQDWVARHEVKVKQYVANYERIGWAWVLEALTNGPRPGDGRGPFVGEVAEKFSQFNIAFEEAYKKQSAWVVTDPMLQDEIKESLSRKIVRIYREFYECFRRFVFAGVARERGMGSAARIVRYTPDDLEDYLSDLFFGGEAAASVSSGTSVSSSSAGSSRGRLST